MLTAIGNKDIEVVDGRFVDSNNVGMTHSWVEKIFDQVGGSVLIETTPQNQLIYPISDVSSFVDKMVILPSDSKRSKYEPWDEKTILEYLKQKNQTLDIEQIKHFSELIITKLFIYKNENRLVTRKSCAKLKTFSKAKTCSKDSLP